jgi:hypothetical protein
MAHIAIQRTQPDATFPWEWVVTDDNHEIYCDGFERTFEWAKGEALLTFERMVDEQDVTITRDNQGTEDAIYVGRWATQARPFRGIAIFVTPDGFGRVYYNTVNAAREDFPHHVVRYVSQIED